MPSFQTIFFILGLIVSVPVLFWYYRRNSHSRFRPRFGEMAMVTLFAVMLCLGGSMLIGGLMDDPEQLKANGGLSTMPGPPSETGEGDDDQEASDRGSSSRKEGGESDRSSRGGGSDR